MSKNNNIVPVSLAVANEGQPAQAQFDRLTGKNVDLLNAYGDKNAQ